MDAREAEVRFPPATDAGEVRGVLVRPQGTATAALAITHGRSNDMRNPLVKRLALAAAESGVAALRMNFRYVDEKARASRDLSREEKDLRGAVDLLRSRFPRVPIFVAGKSMGARVCARASDHPDIRGIIALGYPLHPMFRPQVRNPPEWPMIVKPALFVQGDQDPFWRPRSNEGGTGPTQGTARPNRDPGRRPLVRVEGREAGHVPRSVGCGADLD